MKRFISILFIVLMCGTLLPGIISFNNQPTVLFVTDEEENHDHSKTGKEKKEWKDACMLRLSLLAHTTAAIAFPYFDAVIAAGPSLGNLTPPPDFNG